MGSDWAEMPAWVADAEGTTPQPPTVLHFHIVTGRGRLDALERRDEIVDLLRESLGMRLSLTAGGTEIYLADGTPTVGDTLISLASVIEEDRDAAGPDT